MRLLLCCLSLAASFAWAADALLVDRIVAVVDLHAITWSAVEERARPMIALAKTDAQRAQARREAITELVEDALIRTEAQRLRIDVRADEVEQAVMDIASQNQLTVDELIAATRLQGLDADSYRVLLKQKLLELKWLNLRINRSAAPTLDSDRPAFMASERARLMAQLRANAVVEVRP